MCWNILINVTIQCSNLSNLATDLKKMNSALIKSKPGINFSVEKLN